MAQEADPYAVTYYKSVRRAGALRGIGGRARYRSFLHTTTSTTDRLLLFVLSQLDAQLRVIKECGEKADLPHTGSGERGVDWDGDG